MCIFRMCLIALNHVNVNNNLQRHLTSQTKHQLKHTGLVVPIHINTSLAHTDNHRHS